MDTTARPAYFISDLDSEALDALLDSAGEVDFVLEMLTAAPADVAAAEEQAEEARKARVCEAAGVTYRANMEPCGKCGGSGYIDGYRHIANGVCFKCGGCGLR